MSKFDDVISLKMKQLIETTGVTPLVKPTTSATPATPQTDASGTPQTTQQTTPQNQQAAPQTQQNQQAAPQTQQTDPVQDLTKAFTAMTGDPTVTAKQLNSAIMPILQKNAKLADALEQMGFDRQKGFTIINQQGQ